MESGKLKINAAQNKKHLPERKKQLFNLKWKVEN